MTETLSIRIDTKIKERLDALAVSSKRSKSFLAAAAIEAYLENEGWQLGEIRAGLAELDASEFVAHEGVAEWLKSWGTPTESKAPQ